VAVFAVNKCLVGQGGGRGPADAASSTRGLLASGEPALKPKQQACFLNILKIYFRQQRPNMCASEAKISSQNLCTSPAKGGQQVRLC